MTYRIGIDVGGTFTDLIAVDSEGSLTTAKTLSTPTDPASSLSKGLSLLADNMSSDLSRMLDSTELIVHGSTVALNTLLEKKGARTALLCTSGFRDSLEIRLGIKERRYDWQYAPPTPLVPRKLRLPIRERVDCAGQIHTSLVEEDVHTAIEMFRRESVEAVAVCFLWSFRNESHERRVGAILEAALKDVYISLSVDILPEIREYDRTSTTVVNAYIGSQVRLYVRRVEELLGDLGYSGAIRFMQSNAGIAAPDDVERRPVYVLGSGPAAASAAGLFHASPLGHQNVLTLDMGGTSCDVCLIQDGIPSVRKGFDFHRYRLGIQAIDIKAVGAGGGSIAKIDPGGMLRVGPQSAGAEPGPASYGRGGSEPTVTDANLILGYFPERELSGGIGLKRDLAVEAINSKIGESLGLSLEQAAWAIHAVVNNNMARAIREVSVEQGHDLRDFLLVVGGGCGPIHAAMLAAELHMKEVLIPKIASNFCAFGEVVADLRHSYSRSVPCRISEFSGPALEDAFNEMEVEGRVSLEREGVALENIKIDRHFELRYSGQLYECLVQMPIAPITDAYKEELVHRFHELHKALYAYSEPDNPLVELITIGCVVTAASAKDLILRSTKDALQSPRQQKLFCPKKQHFISVPVYQGKSLSAGTMIDGPAIIEEEGTSVIAAEDMVLFVNEDSYLLSVK